MKARLESYIRTAIIIIEHYTGIHPFQHYTKQYFSQHKKHGSKDRKEIIHACYSYFRLGNSLTHINKEERLKIALFLCNDAAGNWEALFDEIWLTAWHNKLHERIKFIKTLHVSFTPQNIFPYYDKLNEEINKETFAMSHLIQPDLFLRVRHGEKKKIAEKLTDAGIAINEIANNCLALANTTKVNAVLKMNDEVVVQDFSSQQITEFFQLVKNELTEKDKIKVWDCCAASGGKSILANDIFEDIQLTVSDVRPSIIYNLQKRFKEAGIKQYKSFIEDLSNKFNSPGKYDLIICDAPCTGSGTWGRTPEQLVFFNKNKINNYVQLQKQIVKNTMPHLNSKAFFLYITCSVFKKENEEMASFIQKNFSLQLIKIKLIKGYDKKADTMFAALFATV